MTDEEWEKREKELQRAQNDSDSEWILASLIVLIVAAFIFM